MKRFTLSLLLSAAFAIIGLEGSSFAGLTQDQLKKYAETHLCNGPAQQYDDADCQSEKQHCVDEFLSCWQNKTGAKANCIIGTKGDIVCLPQDICLTTDDDGNCTQTDTITYGASVKQCNGVAKKFADSLKNDCNLADKPQVCGDGVVSGDEVCDGSHVKGNGVLIGKCSSDCKVISFCGDGKTEGDEKCDDGDNNGKVGYCSKDCSYKSSKFPDPAPASKSSPFPSQGDVCGDGIKQKTNKEQCDDGNTKDGDGCSHDCKFETDLVAAHMKALCHWEIKGDTACENAQTLCADSFDDCMENNTSLAQCEKNLSAQSQTVVNSCQTKPTTVAGGSQTPAPAATGNAPVGNPSGNTTELGATDDNSKNCSNFGGKNNLCLQGKIDPQAEGCSMVQGAPAASPFSYALIFGFGLIPAVTRRLKKMK